MHPAATGSDFLFSEHGTDDDMRVNRHIPPFYISTQPDCTAHQSLGTGSICRGCLFFLGVFISSVQFYVDMAFGCWTSGKGNRHTLGHRGLLDCK